MLAAASAGGPAVAAEAARYGLIGRIKAQPGRGDELAAILAADAGTMPGCLSYIVAEDVSDRDTLWISEVWSSKDAHAASLKLPQVRAAIAKGRPLIAAFDTVAETKNASGPGLPRA
jgi:quinol monooxygenase YgiN